jgi:hypothetical protein
MLMKIMMRVNLAQTTKLMSMVEVGVDDDPAAFSNPLDVPVCSSAA